jgi:hypothetical protein
MSGSRVLSAVSCRACMVSYGADSLSRPTILTQSCGFPLLLYCAVLLQFVRLLRVLDIRGNIKKHNPRIGTVTCVE